MHSPTTPDDKWTTAHRPVVGVSWTVPSIVVLKDASVQEVVDNILSCDWDSVGRCGVAFLLLGRPSSRASSGKETTEIAPYAADSVRDIDGEGDEGQSLQDVSHGRPEYPTCLLPIRSPGDTQLNEGRLW